jgi:hypothetical protein
MGSHSPRARKIILPDDQRQLYLNLQPHFLTISEDLHTTYSFDREGRFLSGFLGGLNYRRGLCGDILLKRAGPIGAKLCRILSADEGQQLYASILTHVAAIRTLGLSEQGDEVRDWLERILGWDHARLEAERAAFQTIYKPVSILPPDQYLSLVLQAAEGCSWNRCSFCTFYHDRRFRIKSPAEFRAHAQQARAFVGQALGLRKSIFLGDANALIIPQARLRELLEIVHAEFPIGGTDGLKGIYSFLDIFGAEQKSVDDYRELRDAQVRRIYIGLETGDDTVFRLLNKPGSPGECVEAVRTIRAAGIGVGVILLAGAGGTRLADQHVAHSLDALAAMGLGEDDIVYLSPLIVPDDGSYNQDLQAAGSVDLDSAGVAAQLTQLKAGARAVVGAATKVTPYQIQEFVY